MAHWFGFGVKVYVPVPAVTVEIVVGFHVPVIPEFETKGKDVGVSSIQKGPSTLN